MECGGALFFLWSFLDSFLKCLCGNVVQAKNSCFFGRRGAIGGLPASVEPENVYCTGRRAASGTPSVLTRTNCDPFLVEVDEYRDLSKEIRAEQSIGARVPIWNHVEVERKGAERAQLQLFDAY